MDKYLSVSQLTKYISYKFDADPYLETVYLTGEISNISRNNPKGHQYFTLKDEDAQIQVVMFRHAFQRVKFQPRDGDKVLVIGRVTVYPARGNYQIIIEHMEPDGIGQLYKKYEETKERLSKEGIFNLPKKEIPRFPRRIGVITSSSGAVIHDIILNVKNRYPIVQILLYPTVVQGESAAESIVRNIQRADRKGQLDVLIIGRGGGSFEDLFAFNEEAVVRAIAAAETPIISSVGHETDTTLSDFVADYRASTPTEAAVIATPKLSEELLNVQNTQQRLLQNIHYRLQESNKRLERVLSSYVMRQPQRLYEEYQQKTDLLTKDLQVQALKKLELKEQSFNLQVMRLTHYNPQKKIEPLRNKAQQVNSDLQKVIIGMLNQKRQQTNHFIESLDLLSPLKILKRGYTYTTMNDEIISSVKDVKKDDELNIHIYDGELKVKVNEVIPLNQEQEDK